MNRDKPTPEQVYQARVDRAMSIADHVAGGRGISGFFGVDANTRRIAHRAAIDAAKISLNAECPECNRVSRPRKWMLSANFEHLNKGR